MKEMKLRMEKNISSEISSLEGVKVKSNCEGAVSELRSSRRQGPGDLGLAFSAPSGWLLLLLWDLLLLVFFLITHRWAAWAWAVWGGGGWWTLGLLLLLLLVLLLLVWLLSSALLLVFDEGQNMGCNALNLSAAGPLKVLKLRKSPVNSYIGQLALSQRLVDICELINNPIDCMPELRLILLERFHRLLLWFEPLRQDTCLKFLGLCSNLFGNLTLVLIIDLSCWSRLDHIRRREIDDWLLLIIQISKMLQFFLQ